MDKIDIKITPDIPKSFSLSEGEVSSMVNKSIKLLATNLTGELELEIIFLSKEQIRALNQKYRDIDKPTDVLSFPQSQVENGPVNILGSIVICAAKVEEKEEEPADVIKHGLLHLLGYDHETEIAEWDTAAKKINCKL